MWTLEVTVWTGILYSFCIFQFGDIENLVIFSPQKNSSISPIHTLEKAHLSKNLYIFWGLKKKWQKLSIKKNQCVWKIWNACNMKCMCWVMND
jgi:hypothetical protein